MLSAPGQEDFRLLLCRPEPVSSESLRRIRVWGWEGLAVDQGDAASAWVSEAVGVPNLRLLRFAAQRSWTPAELEAAKLAVPGEGNGAQGNEEQGVADEDAEQSARGQGNGAVGDSDPVVAKDGAQSAATLDASPSAASPRSPLPPVPASLSSLEPRRAVDPLWSPPGTETAFSDEFPYLIATLASLESANEAVCAATGGRGPRLDIRRFRPNVVVSGASPWEEDGWERLRIGGAVFDVAKPCSRCVMTTVDPDTGTRPREGPRAEPLETLRALRSGKALGWTGKTPANFDDAVFFGWNAAALPIERHSDTGSGDERDGSADAFGGAAKKDRGAADATANSPAGAPSSTHPAPGTVRVGDAIQVLRRRSGAPLEGAAADREWRADAGAHGSACPFASSACASGDCPIAAGVQALWNLLTRAIAASGLSPYALGAAFVALVCFYAGFAFAGRDAAPRQA